jgi:DNA-binding HxlR family transcriptional regulator
VPGTLEQIVGLAVLRYRLGRVTTVAYLQDRLGLAPIMIRARCQELIDQGVLERTKPTTGVPFGGYRLTEAAEKALIRIERA